MENRVALITGASSGIGCAAALAFARESAHVVALARRAERLNELERAVAALPGAHGDILTITADVRDAGALQDAVAQAMARFGRLDVLVANAGIGQRGDLVGADWADIETLLRTNIDGVLHSIRAAVPAMRQSGGGHIIIVSSVSARLIMPYAAAYGASKAFVSSMARSLRLELESDHIQVTDLLVGRTQTEFNAKRRGSPRPKGRVIPIMSAEQVAEAIVRASKGRGRTATLRWFDRLLLWANLIAPGVLGRLALRQYK